MGRIRIYLSTLPALKGIACTLFFLYTQNIGALDDNTKVIQKPTSFKRSYYLHVERQIATSPIQEGYLSSTLNYIVILVFKELTTREVMTYTCFSQQAKVEGSNVGALCLSGKRSAQSFQDLGKKLKTALPRHQIVPTVQYLIHSFYGGKTQCCT